MTLKTYKEIFLEARAELSPTAIKAMYEKGRQDNPEGEVARNMYKKFTGQDWKANTSATTKKADSTSPPKNTTNKQPGINLVKKIYELIDKAIAIGDDIVRNTSDDIPFRSLTTTKEQRELLINAKKLSYKHMFEPEMIPFFDSLSEEEYDNFTSFFDMFDDSRLNKLTYTGSVIGKKYRSLTDALNIDLDES